MNFLNPLKVKTWLNRAKNLINVLSSTEFLSEMTHHFGWPSIRYSFDKSVRCTAMITLSNQQVIAISDVCSYSKYAQHQANLFLIKKLYNILNQSLSDLILLKSYLSSIDDGIECGICEEYIQCTDYNDHIKECKKSKLCCPICYEGYNDKIVALSCGHHLCINCGEKCARGKSIRCPLCRNNSDYFSLFL